MITSNSPSTVDMARLWPIRTQTTTSTNYNTTQTISLVWEKFDPIFSHASLDMSPITIDLSIIRNINSTWLNAVIN